VNPERSINNFPINKALQMLKKSLSPGNSSTFQDQDDFFEVTRLNDIKEESFADV
jgi:hypothetical protein